ncbi:MAG: FtsQ-type POTRA domain-containing protein [Candidatus Latescibacteria bacterium]|nr:FtsQ-type POTRA domain-containing protein [Candidatus Latescibacterota bacterium]
MKKKTKRSQNSPRWKQDQVKIKRKPVNTKRSGKKIRLPQMPSVSGLIRFVILIFLFSAVLWLVGRPVVRSIASHPVFNVRDVVVEGAQYLNEEEIIETASVELNANIYDIDIERISQSLQKTYTAEDFTIFRRLPHTIVIDITERKPVALLNMDSMVGVDENGVPLPHIGADLVESLPIITGIKSVSSLADSTVRARLLTGLNMLNSISEDAPSVYKRISEVDVTTTASMGISLVDNGIDVIIGDKDWKRKIPTLAKIINEVTRRDDSIKAVDIRFGEKIYVKK